MTDAERSKPWIKRIFSGKNALFFLIIAVAFATLNIYRLNDPLEPGSKMPDFKLETLNGDTFNISDIKMPVVLVFYKKHEYFSNYVFNYHYRRLLPQLKFLQDNNYAQVIVIEEKCNTPEKMSALASDNKHSVLKSIGYSADTKSVAAAYGIRSWPHLFVAGSNGIILYEAKLASVDFIRGILWRD